MQALPKFRYAIDICNGSKVIPTKTEDSMESCFQSPGSGGKINNARKPQHLAD